jgi:hypothetical protein
MTVAQLMDEHDEAVSRRPLADTDTERWMREQEAYDAVTNTLLARLWDADPGTGCGIGRAKRRDAS